MRKKEETKLVVSYTIASTTYTSGMIVRIQDSSFNKTHSFLLCSKISGQFQFCFKLHVLGFHGGCTFHFPCDCTSTSYPRSSTGDSFSVRPRKAPAILLFLYAQHARPSRHVAYGYVVYRDHRHSSSSTDITNIGCHALVDLVDPWIIGSLHRRAGLVSTPVCLAPKKLQAGYIFVMTHMQFICT